MTTTIVSSGQSRGGFTLSAGDLLEVLSGGEAGSMTALSGSEIHVFAGGQLYQDGFEGSLGGEVVLDSGALLWGDPGILKGGELLGDGTVEGYAFVAGVASGVNIGSGSAFEAGRLEVLSGGLAQSVTIRWGELYVDAGGTASGAVLASNSYPYPGTVNFAWVQGVAIGTRLGVGGYEYVQSGGVTSGAEIGRGGLEIVSGGGIARGAFVSSGGTIDIRSGGIGYSTSVENGGIEIVEAGAATSNSTVGYGASATIQGGGADKFARIWNGGVETVQSGATVLFSTISSGGDLVVLSGGAVRGGLMIVGGDVEIRGLVASGAVVTFAGAGGDLALEDPTGFNGVISGLSQPSQKIDLGGFAYGAGETASWTQAQGGVSGTLTVTDGADSIHLTLAGAYATSNFVLSDDGHGGTFVADPRTATSAHSAPTVAGLAQAISLFAGGLAPSIDGATSPATASAAFAAHSDLAPGR